MLFQTLVKTKKLLSIQGSLLGPSRSYVMSIVCATCVALISGVLSFVIIRPRIDALDMTRKGK